MTLVQSAIIILGREGLNLRPTVCPELYLGPAYGTNSLQSRLCYPARIKSCAVAATLSKSIMEAIIQQLSLTMRNRKKVGVLSM